MKFGERRRREVQAVYQVQLGTQNVLEREMLKNRENRGGFIFPCWQLITFSLIQ